MRSQSVNCGTQYAFLMLMHTEKIVTYLHEEHVCHIELPDVMLTTKLHALPENLLHLAVVLHVPVDLGLSHEYGDVALQSFIVLLNHLLHSVVIVALPMLLHLLCQLAKFFCVAGCNIVQLTKCLVVAKYAGKMEQKNLFRF